MIIVLNLIVMVVGLVGLGIGFTMNNLVFVISGGVLAIMGIILLVGYAIVSAIDKAGNRNISALNEIILGLSN